MQKMFEERFQAPPALDAPLDFLNFSVRQFFPAWPDWRVVSQPVEKNFDLVQRESHLAGKPDEEHAVECVRRIAPLATRTVGYGKQTASFVVADCGGLAQNGWHVYLLSFPPAFLYIDGS
jgi:hypothetical protein